MVTAYTPLERLETLEARVVELQQGLKEIQETQAKILVNDEQLFAIHKHNDEWMKEIHEQYVKILEKTK